MKMSICKLLKRAYFVWNLYTISFVSVIDLECLKVSVSLFVWYFMEQKGPNHPEAEVFETDDWEDCEDSNSYRKTYMISSYTTILSV